MIPAAAQRATDYVVGPAYMCVQMWHQKRVQCDLCKKDRWASHCVAYTNHQGDTVYHCDVGWCVDDRYREGGPLP